MTQHIIYNVPFNANFTNYNLDPFAYYSYIPLSSMHLPRKSYNSIDENKLMSLTFYKTKIYSYSLEHRDMNKVNIIDVFARHLNRTSTLFFFRDSPFTGLF